MKIVRVFPPRFFFIRFPPAFNGVWLRHPRLISVFGRGSHEILRKHLEVERSGIDRADRPPPPPESRVRVWKRARAGDSSCGKSVGGGPIPNGTGNRPSVSEGLVQAPPEIVEESDFGGGFGVREKLGRPRGGHLRSQAQPWRPKVAV